MIVITSEIIITNAPNERHAVPDDVVVVVVVGVVVVVVVVVTVVVVSSSQERFMEPALDADGQTAGYRSLHSASVHIEHASTPKGG